MITLDGSHEEGGGAILRTALAMSVATGKPFRITGIRANRPQPGLKQQHLVGIQAIQEWCGGKVTDCHPGSMELTFIPGNKLRPTVTIDAGTAAPMTLILQSFLPAIAHHGKRTKFIMTGGTDVKWAPPIDYFTNILSRVLKDILQIDVKLTKRGYYPKGGGQAEILIVKKSDMPLSFLARGNLIRYAGNSNASLSLEKPRVAERQAQAARVGIRNRAEGTTTINIMESYSIADSPGSGMVVWAEFDNAVLGADALGERGIPAEKVGEDAVGKLFETLNKRGAIDPWLCDQLIPFLALLGGELTTTEVTKHTLSNIKVCEEFLDITFEVEGNKIEVKRGKK